MRKTHRLFFFLCCTLPSLSFGQHIAGGRVIDGQSNLPLAFVSIIFNNDAHSGTTTDIDGKFYFSSSKKIIKISCSYVGYKNLAIDIAENSDAGNLVIKMYSSVSELKEVIVRSGENPANRIIRKVIQNKDINNPEKVTSFKYTSYNKIVYDFRPNAAMNTDSIKQKANLDKVFKGGHVFMMESVTERKFIAPDKSEERIIGTKVSGLKDPPFAPLATDVQPFSFYKEVIPLLGMNFVNPISNGSLNRYDFRIEDTLFRDADTVYVISFKPKPGKNFEPLTGVLYINTNQYAVQHVIAEPYEKGFIDIKLQQQYEWVNNQQWFPSQLNFELLFREYPSKEMGISANGKGYIRDVELYADVKQKELSAASVIMDDSAGRRDSQFWASRRAEPLHVKEKITYQVIDSLGEKINFDKKLRFIERLLQGRIQVGFIDVDLTKTLVFNRYESYRAGLGLYTNDKLSRHISVGGFFGYGIKDKRWKYGGELIVTPGQRKEFEIRGKYQATIAEAGIPEIKAFDNYNSIRAYMGSRMDYIRQYDFSVGFRAVKYAKLKFSFDHTEVQPLYEYEYAPDNQQKITSYTSSALSVSLRYAYGEKLFRSGDQQMSLGTKYPILYLTYSKGLKGIYNSRFDFNKIEARITGSFVSKYIGQTSFTIDGGIADRGLPYGLLFTGEGAYDKRLRVPVNNYFQTIRPYEFLSDRYANLFLVHNFGSLLLKTKKFQPVIIIQQNIGWGSLSHPEHHQLIEFKTKEKGFFESGLRIDNILKLNYLNLLYLGVGGAVYYRYGPYAYADTGDNLVFKFTFSFSAR